MTTETQTEPNDNIKETLNNLSEFLKSESCENQRWRLTTDWIMSQVRRMFIFV